MYKFSRALFEFYERRMLPYFAQEKQCWKYVYGTQNIPYGGPLIVVANHISDADPWRIGAQLPEHVVYWWAKKELFSVPVHFAELRGCGHTVVSAAVLAVGAFLLVKYGGAIAVDRTNVHAAVNRTAIQSSIRILRDGGTIGIFGEGGVNRHNEAKQVFVRLAQKCKVPILPIKVHDAYICIGALITPDELSKLNKTHEDTSAIAHIIMKRINAMSPTQFRDHPL